MARACSESPVSALIIVIDDPIKPDEAMSEVKWSGKFGQRAKMYPTRTNGYENDKTTELFRPV
jgi:hypothetical protein